MDTREVHAQHAHAAARNALKPTTFPAAALYMQSYRPPHYLEERNACIAEAAYFIAMRRGFSAGHELEDWLKAENEVDARLFGAPREY